MNVVTKAAMPNMPLEETELRSSLPLSELIDSSFWLGRDTASEYIDSQSVAECVTVDPTHLAREVRVHWICAMLWPLLILYLQHETQNAVVSYIHICIHVTNKKNVINQIFMSKYDKFHHGRTMIPD